MRGQCPSRACDLTRGAGTFIGRGADDFRANCARAADIIKRKYAEKHGGAGGGASAAQAVKKGTSAPAWDQRGAPKAEDLGKSQEFGTKFGKGTSIEGAVRLRFFSLACFRHHFSPERRDLTDRVRRHAQRPNRYVIP